MKQGGRLSLTGSPPQPNKALSVCRSLFDRFKASFVRWVSDSLQRQSHRLKIQHEACRLHVQIFPDIGKYPVAMILAFRHDMGRAERQVLSVNLK